MIKRMSFAIGCVAFMQCFLPASADIVTLSAVSPGSNRLTGILPDPGTFGKLGPDNMGISTGSVSDEQNLDIILNGITYNAADCVLGPGGTKGCNIPRITAASSFSITIINKDGKRKKIYIMLRENTGIMADTWYSGTIVVPAGHVVSASVQNYISVELKGNSSKEVQLSTPTAGNAEEGVLTFTPTATDGKEGEITSGSHVIGYDIPGAAWNGKAWEAKNISTNMLRFNPANLTLAPGKYEGTLQAQLSVP